MKPVVAVFQVGNGYMVVNQTAVVPVAGIFGQPPPHAERYAATPDDVLAEVAAIFHKETRLPSPSFAKMLDNIFNGTMKFEFPAPNFDAATAPEPPKPPKKSKNKPHKKDAD